MLDILITCNLTSEPERLVQVLSRLDSDAPEEAFIVDIGDSIANQFIPLDEILKLFVTAKYSTLLLTENDIQKIFEEGNLDLKGLSAVHVVPRGPFEKSVQIVKLGYDTNLRIAVTGISSPLANQDLFRKALELLKGTALFRPSFHILLLNLEGESEQLPVQLLKNTGLNLILIRTFKGFPENLQVIPERGYVEIRVPYYQLGDGFVHVKISEGGAVIEDR